MRTNLSGCDVSTFAVRPTDVADAEQVSSPRWVNTGSSDAADDELTGPTSTLAPCETNESTVVSIASVADSSAVTEAIGPPSTPPAALTSSRASVRPRC